MGNDKIVKRPPRACTSAVIAAIMVVHTARALLPASTMIAKPDTLYTETSITNRYSNPAIAATANIIIQFTISFETNMLSGL